VCGTLKIKKSTFATRLKVSKNRSMIFAGRLTLVRSLRLLQMMEELRFGTWRETTCSLCLLIMTRMLKERILTRLRLLWGSLRTRLLFWLVILLVKSESIELLALSMFRFLKKIKSSVLSPQSLRMSSEMLELKERKLKKKVLEKAYYLI